MPSAISRKAFVSGPATPPIAFSEKPQFEGDFGSFKTNPHAWHQVTFPEPVSGRYLRIVYPDEVNNTKCVASAEIEILVKP